jgi:shikimate dehydrogenase
MSQDRYAVLGNPVAHSQSPFIHAMFAQATGEPVEYVRVLCPLDGFEGAVRAFADAGGKGCNVTVPFKFEAPRLAARVSARAALAQAANLLRFDRGDDGWLADNTDGVGLVNDIERNAGVPIAGTRVLLVGAGGAAAGVLGPLLAARPAELVVANRTPDKARRLVERHAAVAGGTVLRACALDDCGERFDIVLNSASTSLAGAAIPVGATVLRPGALAVDLMYGPAALGFVRWAERHGATGRDGLGMLVEQAAEAFFVWRGVRPQTPPVLAALRARLAGEGA